MNHPSRIAGALGAVALVFLLFPAPARADSYDLSSCYDAHWSSNYVKAPKWGLKQICLKDVCKYDRDCDTKNCKSTPVYFKGERCMDVKVYDDGKSCKMSIMCTDGKNWYEHDCKMDRCDYDDCCKKMCMPKYPPPPCDHQVPEPTSLLLLGLGALGAGRTLRRRFLG